MEGCPYPRELFINEQGEAVSPAPTNPKELWLRCPYNSSHKVPFGKFRKHLDKCKTNYIIGKLTKGEPLNTLCCRYNPNHQFYPPELCIHEYSCPERREYEFVLQVFSGICDDLVKIAKEKDDDKVESPTKETASGAQTKEEQDANLFLKAQGFDPEIIASSIQKMFLEKTKDNLIWADPTTVAAHNKRRMLPIENPTRYQRLHRSIIKTNLPKIPEESSGCKDDSDYDEAGWNLNTGRSFNWLQNQQEEKMPLACKQPLGLTKKLRKQYVEETQDILKFEYGFFKDAPAESVTFPNYFEVDATDIFVPFGAERDEKNAKTDTDLNKSDKEWP